MITKLLVLSSVAGAAVASHTAFRDDLIYAFHGIERGAPMAVAATAAAAEPSADSLISLLQRGGYVVMLRHTHTDRTVQEPTGYVPTERAQQRNLSDRGFADARMIGAIMKLARIPFAEIVASPMYRTVETAELAFGKPDTTMLLRNLDETPAQRALITKSPAARSNRAIVTHHFLIERYAPGIRPGDIDEGEAVVLSVANDKTLSLVGRFKLADWRRLVGVDPVAGTPPAAPTTPPASHAPPGTPPGAVPNPANDPAIMHGPAAQVASGYIRAFNTGNADSMRVFLESTMVPIADRPIATRLETYKTMFAQHGPLAIVGLEGGTPGEVRIKVRTTAGEFTLTVVAEAGGAGPARGRSVTLTGPGGRGGH